MSKSSWRLVASSVLVLLTAGCGSSSEILAQTKQCTVDADCSGNGWCLDGVCQTPYGLTLTIDKAPAADGKVHVSSALNLSATVTGGTPPVEFALVDEGRLQLVASPYSWQWDVKAAKVTEGSHRVIATAKGGTRTYSSQAIEVIVDRVAPAKPILGPVASPTNKDPVVLTGTGEEKATVRVVEGTNRLAEVEVLSGGTWDVSMKGLPEGTHNLTLTATDLGGNTSDPVALTVEVDRAPPKVIDAVPNPGLPAAANVVWDAPITVQFDKAMNADTLLKEPANVALTANGVAVPTSLEVSQDDQGHTRLTINPRGSPTTSDVTLTLGGDIMDVAGNHLARVSWNWTVPEWLDLANPVFADSSSIAWTIKKVAVDGTGAPTLAMYGVKSAVIHSVFAWNGSAWNKIRDNASGWLDDLELDSHGRPSIATHSWLPQPWGVYVVNWGGAAWSGIPSAATSSPRAEAGSLRLDGADNPVVALTDVDDSVSPATYSLNVARGQNSSWSLLAQAPGVTTPPSPSDIEMFLDGQGNPTVSWRQGSEALYQWTPGSSPIAWQFPVLPAGYQIIATRMSPDQQHPILALLDSSTSVSRLLVYRHSCPVLTCGRDPTFWGIGPTGAGTPLGRAPLNMDPGTSAGPVSIALDGDGFPIVAWVEGDQLFAKRWTGTTWKVLTTASIDFTNAIRGLSPYIAVGSKGHIVVTWIAITAYQIRIVNAMRYNRK